MAFPETQTTTKRAFAIGAIDVRSPSPLRTVVPSSKRPAPPQSSPGRSKDDTSQEMPQGVQNNELQGVNYISSHKLIQL